MTPPLGGVEAWTKHPLTGKMSRPYRVLGGATTPPATDPFVLGVTRPTRERNGPYWGAIATLENPAYSDIPQRDPNEPLTKWSTISSSNLVATVNGDEFHFIDFEDKFVEFRGADQRLFGCKGLNRTQVPSGSRGHINVHHAGVLRARVEFCDFENRAEAWHLSGIVGHDVRVVRSNFTGHVDGMSVFNNNGVDVRSGPMNVHVSGTWFGPLAGYKAATTGIVHPSDTKTHNECVQWQGGSLGRFTGNAFHAQYSTVAGHTFAPGEPFDLNGWTLSNNVGDSSDIWLDDNWYFGGEYSHNSGAQPKSGAPTNIGRLLRNKFDRTQAYQGAGGDDTYTIVVASGWTVDTGTGDDRNFYMDPNDPELGRDFAHPVRVRR